MIIEAIASALIMKGEGYRPESYLCSKGKLTWGYGRNYQENPLTVGETNQIVTIIGEHEKYKDRDFAKQPLSMDDTTNLLSGTRIGQEKALTIAEFLLKGEVENIAGVLSRNLQGWTNLSPARQAVMIDMRFNMGPSFPATWPRLMKAIRDSDWEEAGKQIMASDYARDVGTRAVRNASIMEKGVLPSWAQPKQEG